MKYELIESPDNPGHWHVEAFDEEGECVKAVFSGPGAKRIARIHFGICLAMDDGLGITTHGASTGVWVKSNPQAKSAMSAWLNGGGSVELPNLTSITEDGPFTTICKKFGWDK